MDTPAKNALVRFTPARVALLYAAAAALWILASGRLLEFAVSDPQWHGRIEIGKGMLFVAVTGTLLYLLLKGWHRSPEAVGHLPKTLPLLPAFAALMLAVPLFSLVFFKLHTPHTEAEAYRNLEAVARLKADEAANWLNERDFDAEGLIASSGFAERIAQRPDARRSGLPPQTLSRLGALRAPHAFDSILVLDADGHLLGSLGDDLDIPPLLREALRLALETGRMQRTDIYRDGYGRINLDWVAPLAVPDRRGKRMVAAVVLRAAPDRFLYPLIRNWPADSASAETMLVRRDGGSVLFLNELRHKGNTALALSFPMSDKALPAAIAVRAQGTGTVRGKDYRGVDVLAAYRPVAGTGWHLVAKIDREEVMGPVWNFTLWLTLTAFTAVAAIMAVLLLLWRQQLRALHLALAAQAVEESEQRLRAIAQSANDAIITADAHGNVSGWNSAAGWMFGYTEAEITGQPLTLLMPERFRAAHRAGLARRAAGGDPHVAGTVELAGLHKDGSEFPLELTLAQWKTAAGKFFTAIIRDISRRRETEEELKKRKAFVETLLENAPIGFAVNTLDDGRFTFVSRRFAEYYGVPPGALEAVGDFFDKVYRDPVFREDIRARVMADIASGDAARMHWEDVPIISPDGACRHISAANIPLPEQNMMISIVWDVTDRYRAELALRESEEIFRCLMEFSPIYVFFKDADLRSLRLSRNYEKMLGKPLSELIGKRMDEIFPGGFAQRMIADDRRVMDEGEAITVEEEFGGRYYATTKFPIFIGGQPRFLAGYTMDITERRRSAERQEAEYRHIAEINAQLVEANEQLKQAQSQLLQSEKMAAIGHLAAGVAHEINNPIGYVNSNLGTLEKYLADILTVLNRYEAAETRLDRNDPLLDDLRQIKKKTDLDYIREDVKALLAESHHGLERVKKIVLDLKNFSRADIEERWVRADLHKCLDDTLNVVWNELKYKCEVVKEYGELPEIDCLPLQLDQVFLNLLVNAAQAIETRGKITIRTGQEGGGVWVEIADTGKGIPPENIPHLFEPFFTTKPVGQGTGLGLSVSYNIVAKHHGRIEVRSEVGKGTAFRVCLPAQQPG